MHLVAVDQLNTYDVLASDDVVFSKGAYDAFVRPAQSHGKSDRDRYSARLRRRRPVSTLHKDHRDILIAPVVSEKSYSLLDANKYTFLVHPDANKTEIKIAVEKVFNVKVTSVNTLNRQGKTRRTKYGTGQAQGHQARDRQPRRGPPHRHLRRTGR